ncbi:uncharacterized protein LOC125194562 [Salvia hispanica]|uniref:uncharacterized protein LOC125194562 n=1 Tax=Salvia hispanica TaxID=49212 RepID=UPI0020097C06|nr:uncharacterized protein LOC125194562 [Salvia hispanica]
MLSSNTIYGCYLVFKLDRNSYGLESSNAFVRFMNDKVDGDDEILDHFRRENARDHHSRTGEAPVRIGDGLTEIAEVHLQRPTGKSESPGKQNSWGRNYRPHGRRRPSPPPVRIGDGFMKKDEMQRANGSQSGRVAVRRGDGWMEVEWEASITIEVTTAWWRHGCWGRKAINGSRVSSFRIYTSVQGFEKPESEEIESARSTGSNQEMSENSMKKSRVDPLKLLN